MEMEDFKERCRKIKLIASEIDAVITDGMLPTDELGNVPFKNFYMPDFEAINMLKREFIFVFVSKDNRINYHLCQSKNIPFFYNKSSKSKALRKAMERYSVGPEEVMYIGSTYSDLENVQMVPFSFCTYDAPAVVKERSYDVIEMYGGQGVLSVVLDLLSQEISRRKASS
jgi:3-deoxy-D-manno-octulosonate 8-phosphate phosphatase KdsC-like HAD superfamily phosphatase